LTKRDLQRGSGPTEAVGFWSAVYKAQGLCMEAQQKEQALLIKAKCLLSGQCLWLHI